MMKFIVRVICMMLTFSLTRSGQGQAVDYPPTRQVDVVDDYQGVKVSDPYRWLEELNSEETKAWVHAQNAITVKYLESLPMREVFRKRITELWDYPKVSVPWREGGRLWYRRNSGLQL
jgi:prolyl oligopeptidase